MDSTSATSSHNTTWQEKDFVLPFMLDNGKASGRLVRLGTELSDITAKHQYPACVNQYLSELIALGAALIMDLKSKGKITLQITQGAIINMIVAEVTSDGHIRGCATFDEKALAETTKSTFAQLFAGGHFVFTVEFDHLPEKQQAIVELTGETLAECMQHYFTQSAQLPTVLCIFSNLNPTADESAENKMPYGAGAILLQHMPHEVDAESADNWTAYSSLLATLTSTELLSPQLTAETILHWLFHEHSPAVFPAKEIMARCSCSKERLMGILQNFDEAALSEMIVDGSIEAGCQFCGHNYVFAEGDISEMLKTKSL